MFSKSMRLLVAGGALLFIVADSQPVSAQSPDQVYTPAQLTATPRLTSMDRAARIIQESYPVRLRDAGIGGVVKLQLIVGADGKVEPASIEVVVSDEPELGEAAKRAVTRLEFMPGKLNNVSVRSRVILPIQYRAG